MSEHPDFTSQQGADFKVSRLPLTELEQKAGEIYYRLRAIAEQRTVVTCLTDRTEASSSLLTNKEYLRMHLRSPSDDIVFITKLGFTTDQIAGGIIDMTRSKMIYDGDIPPDRTMLYPVIPRNKYVALSRGVDIKVIDVMRQGDEKHYQEGTLSEDEILAVKAMRKLRKIVYDIGNIYETYDKFDEVLRRIIPQPDFSGINEDDKRHQIIYFSGLPQHVKYFEEARKALSLYMI
jgi:hypothetical protein